jgi:hypothetical protein
MNSKQRRKFVRSIWDQFRAMSEGNIENTFVRMTNELRDQEKLIKKLEAENNELKNELLSAELKLSLALKDPCS